LGGGQAALAGPSGKDSRQADLRDGNRGPALTVYVDTSALLKVYIEEEGSALVRDQLDRATQLATSAITRVEVHTALARRRHGRDLPQAAYREVVRAFEADWERVLRLAVSDAVLGQATRLGAEHVLRAYDAIHLSSAVLLRTQIGGEVLLASWDDDLDAAALRERFAVLRPRRR
jgi:predicted nucleic acid-binding protein